MNLEELQLGVMDRLFQVGDDYITLLDELKAATAREKLSFKNVEGKRKAAEKLSVKDPWR